MIIICITICIVTALVCATICYIYREKTYSTSDLSEQQLLEDIHILAINEHSRNQDDIESNDSIDEDSSLYIAAKNTLFALDTIINLTKDYKH